MWNQILSYKNKPNKIILIWFSLNFLSYNINNFYLFGGNSKLIRGINRVWVYYSMCILILIT